ncbi:hypothetical protein [Bacillus sp. J33]|uniref:hypothetical protein n=1 Tax=Bacillus sp. J33 TaxID=935836 RepID=UPI00047D196E|nr:hypothetical protein [Bacillus sp. J33]
MDEDILEGMFINKKEQVIAFLNKTENASIYEQIKIAYKRSKELFPKSRIKIEVLPDYESGEKVLLFLIESRSSLEEDFALLQQLYEHISLNDHFIVDLEFAR